MHREQHNGKHHGLFVSRYTASQWGHLNGNSNMYIYFPYVFFLTLHPSLFFMCICCTYKSVVHQYNKMYMCYTTANIIHCIFNKDDIQIVQESIIGNSSKIMLYYTNRNIFTSLFIITSGLCMLYCNFYFTNFPVLSL